jgi:hypothetical protein
MKNVKLLKLKDLVKKLSTEDLKQLKGGSLGDTDPRSRVS